MNASYEGIVLLHGADARGVLRIVDERGVEAAMVHLKTLDVPGQGTLIGSDGPPWKETDTVIDDGSGSVMYFDASAPYIGLVSRIPID